MRQTAKLTGAFLGLAIILIVSGCARKRPSDTGEMATVVGVIDGDTVELEDGRRVRLIGIDTPERGDLYSDSATNLTTRLCLNKRIRMEFDSDKIDRYGRTLAFLWDDTLLVNREIIQQGWAWCYFFQGNLRHSRDLLLAQREAMDNQLGLWREVPASDENRYRASFVSYRFHRPDCKGMDRVDPDLEVVYESKLSAFYDGYSPCGMCNP